MNIIKIVENTISEHNMLMPGDRVLVGLSGGADSVALLHIFCSLAKKYGISLEAAHINHCLRTTADRDMQFCMQLCDKLGIKLHCLTADIKNGAKKAGLGEEIYAREVRYSFFDNIDCDKIATAHNKNDAAETILLHFLRGASVRGLSGIPYTRGKIIRPLLDVKKSDIFDFCNNSDYEYMTDETNLENIYTRNKIRLNLIPEIEKVYNPAFIDVVTQNAKLFSEDADYLDSVARREYNGKIFLDKFSSYDIAVKRRLLQLHYKSAANTRQNLPNKYIENLLHLINNCSTGQKINLPHELTAGLQYGELIIEKNPAICRYEYIIKPDVLLKIPEIGKTVIITEQKGGGIFLENTDGLTIRSKKNGDFFYPCGMKGKKKLSDYFTDKKIPSRDRNKIPLLVQGENIVSIIGMRNDRRFNNSNFKEYKLELKEICNAD